MTIPVFQAGHVNSGGFSFTRTGSFDVGASAASIVAFALAEDGLSLVRIDSIVIGGLSMTALTDRSFSTEYGAHGRCRGFELIGSGLTGTQSYTVSCTTLAGVADNNSKPSVVFATFSDVVSATTASRTAVSVNAGNTFSSTIASSAGSRAVFVGLRSTSVVTATSPTTKNVDAAIGGYTALVLSEPGAASSVLEAVSTSVDVYIGQLWSLDGAAAAPIITGPTGAATGNTTANAGATIDAVSGSGSRIMYSLARIGGSPASSATIISTGTQLAITSAGAKSVALTGLTPGASYSADVVYVDATTGTSNVVTGTWTQPTAAVLSSPTNTPGSTTALIGATTTVSSGTAYFLARVGGSAASAATIIATGQTSTVSTTTPSRTVTGLTASTANNFVDIVQVSGVTTSNVVSTAAFTTAASGDTTPPTLTSSIVIGTVTSSSIQFSWSAGSDNVAVTSYEVSSNGGGGYVDAGNVMTYTFTGLAASTSYALRVRAKDAAGNVSTPALAATQSTAAASGVGSISLNNAALYTFKTNNGTPIVSTTVTFYVHDATTGYLIGSAITGLSTNASGVVTTAISNASMLAGTQYRLVIESSTGKYGSIKLTAV